MNYYPFHLGDYSAHTGHLEPMEDLAYRRLLDVYYMREGPLPSDVQVTAKLIRLRSCAADVESVLREFFTLTDNGWQHARCNEEIAKMQDKQAKARNAAQHSVDSRRASVERALRGQTTSVERTLSPEQADVELPTPTPTPTLDTKTLAHASRSRELNGAFAEFWAHYPRKKSKGQAEKAWLQIKPDEQLAARIITAVERAKASVDWGKDGGNFIPYPASWLNAKGWEDELFDKKPSYAYDPTVLHI
jgi:uncharacterized protein YdaU (DUF1376 family)